MSSSSKRKKGAAVGPGSFKIANQTVEVVTNHLLSMLPADAGLTSKPAAKLLKAVTLLTSKLRSRDSDQQVAMERASLQDGVVLNGVLIPRELMTHVLSFVPQSTLAMTVAFVSKAFVSLSRDPLLWRSVSALSETEENKPALSKKISMTTVTSVLQRPQFAMLQELTLSKNATLSARAAKQIAKGEMSC